MSWFKKKEENTDSPERVEQDVKYGRAVLKQKHKEERMLAARERIRYELSGKKEHDDLRRARLEKAKGIAKKVGSAAGRGLGMLSSIGKPNVVKGRKGFHREKVNLRGNRPEENKYVSPLFSGGGSPLAGSGRNPLLEAMDRDKQKKKSSGSPLFDELTRR